VRCKKRCRKVSPVFTCTTLSWRRLLGPSVFDWPADAAPSAQFFRAAVKGAWTCSREKGRAVVTCREGRKSDLASSEPFNLLTEPAAWP
jgi:hypothetical protein